MCSILYSLLETPVKFSGYTLWSRSVEWFTVCFNVGLVLKSPFISSLSTLYSITAVRRMILRWMWAPWWERTLSLTFLAMPATLLPWTAQPSSLSLWISWTPVLTTTTVPPVHRTHVALVSQTTCVMEGSVWASTLTTRTGLCRFLCLQTRRALSLWVTTVPQTCFLPLIAPTAPRSDLCCNMKMHTDIQKTLLTYSNTPDIYMSSTRPLVWD